MLDVCKAFCSALCRDSKITVTWPCREVVWMRGQNGHWSQTD